jgi:hypothetical protein
MCAQADEKMFMEILLQNSTMIMIFFLYVFRVEHIFKMVVECACKVWEHIFSAFKLKVAPKNFVN